MSRFADFIVALLAAIHLFILVLEVFFWESGLSLRAFGLTPELAKSTLALGANQGLYNGFLAAGLMWGLYLRSAGRPVKIFFMLCIFVAGIFGALTVNPKILLIQSIPAAVGLYLLWRTR